MSFIYFSHLSCISSYRCCMFVSCYLPSETYGRNGVTLIFRSFHRTASSTTDSWSRLNILMCFLYIILSITVSFLDLTDAILFLQSFSFLCVYISICCPTDTNHKNLELAPPQYVMPTRLDQLVYSMNCYIQISRTPNRLKLKSNAQ